MDITIWAEFIFPENQQQIYSVSGNEPKMDCWENPLLIAIFPKIKTVPAIPTIQLS